MNFVRNPFAIPAAFLLFFATTAPLHAAGPSENHVQVAFANWSDFDNGLHAAGNLRVQDTLRLFARYTSTDLDYLQLGAGWIMPLEPGFSLEFGGSLNFLDSGPVDDTGLGVHAVIRMTPLRALTLSGKFEYILLDDLDNDTVVGFDVDYRFRDNVSGFVNYSSYNEIDNNLILLGARLHF